MYFCKYCNKECKSTTSLTQHEIRCKMNPNRKDWQKKGFNNYGRIAWNQGLTNETDERVKQHSAQVSISMKGKPGTIHSQEYRDKMSALAFERELGGFNMRKRGFLYNGVKLDSTYEVTVAQSLDENNVKWERCKRFFYQTPDGRKHYYTPDFYLPEYDIYLDPKNDFLIEYVNPSLGYKDVDKIKWVMERHNIKIFILDKDSLTWERIKQIIDTNT